MTVSAIDVVVSNIEHLGLFRGYDNQIGFYLNYPENEFNIVSDNAHVVKDTISGFYRVRPGAKNTATFYFVDVNTRDTITEKTLPVKNLPMPSLYFGAIDDGSNVLKSSVKSTKTLFSKYPPEVPLEASFNIKSYSFSFSEMNILVSGVGNRLSDECLEVLKTITSGERIEISAVVLGPDGLNRNVTCTINVL